MTAGGLTTACSGRRCGLPSAFSRRCAPSNKRVQRTPAASSKLDSACATDPQCRHTLKNWHDWHKVFNTGESNNDRMVN